MRTHRLVSAMAALTMLIAGTATAQAGAGPLVEISPSGWVIVREPSNPSYTPAAKDRANASGGAVTVVRQDKGEWTITFVGLTAPAGSNVQVSALGSAPRHCLAWSWDNGPDAAVTVYCYKRVNDPLNDDVAPVDTPFVATYTGMLGDVTGQPGRMAYAWVGTGNADSTPDLSYNQISTGGVITVDRTSLGRYTVIQPGIGKGDGTPLVTGYLGDPRRCQILGWALSGDTLKTRVGCFTIAGVAADAEFDYLYTRRLGFQGFPAYPAASLLADRPTAAASYHPTAGKAWSSAGKRATILRTGKGVYAVTLRGMPKGGAAIATAVGPMSTPRNCQIGSIRTTATPQKVVVRCFTYGGKAADSAFTLTYSK